MNSALRAKRRRLVEREIGTAAMRLFDAEGFDSVTVDRIAAEAGISARTFFRYFASKEDLLLQYQRAIDERLLGALAARPPCEGAVAALRQAYIATSHVAPEDRRSVLLSNRFLCSSRALRERAAGERIVHSGPIIRLLAERADLDPSDPRLETIAVAIGAVAGAAFQRWLSTGGLGDPAEEVGQAIGLIEAGLAKLDSPARSVEK